MTGPAEDVGQQVRLQPPNERAGRGERLSRGRIAGRPQVFEDRADGAVQAGRNLTQADGLVPIVVAQRVLDLGDVLVQLDVRHHRVPLAQHAHDAVAVGQLRGCDRPPAVLPPPVQPRRHPHGEGLRPVLVRVLLGVPAGKVAHVAAAERLRPVLLRIGLGDRAELLDPLLLVVQPVGVVDDVPHLVPEVAQDVGPVEALHQAGPLHVQRGQVGTGEIEGDRDRHRLEGHAPLGGEIEAGVHPGEPGPVHLLLELLDDGLEGGPFDGEAEVPDRHGPEVGLLKAGGLGGHGDKDTC